MCQCVAPAVQFGKSLRRVLPPADRLGDLGVACAGRQPRRGFADLPAGNAALRELRGLEHPREQRLSARWVAVRRGGL